MKRLNLTWWNEIVSERQQHYATNTHRPYLGNEMNSIAAVSLPPPPPRPIWLPGYPGSGNEMTNQLVQALTGGLGGMDIYKARPDRQCTPSLTATCKTHWPVFLKTKADPRGNLTGLYSDGGTNDKIIHPWATKVNFFPLYVVLIRNPMNAIPSFVNSRYEKVYKLPGHSTQASPTFWREDRDDKFDWFMNEWVGLIEEWQSYEEQPVNLQRAMILPYEQLTTMEYGPMLAIRLARLLRMAGYDDIVAKDEDIPCLWYHIVVSRSLSNQLGTNFDKDNTIRARDNNNDKKVASKVPNSQTTTRMTQGNVIEGTGGTKRSPGKYIPEYTMSQKRQMMKALNDLKNRWNKYGIMEESRRSSKYIIEKNDTSQNVSKTDCNTNTTTSVRFDHNDLELITILDDYLKVINTTMHIEESTTMGQ